MISVLEITLKVAAVPLNVTLVVPFNLFPKTMTLVPRSVRKTSWPDVKVCFPGKSFLPSLPLALEPNLV